MIGRKIGPYDVVAKLGEGGMGEVYRAHDARLRRDVAIKVLPPAFATDDERMRRFEQEAHAAAALNHPNILAVYDVGRTDGTAFVVTELLEGQTLRDAIGAGPLPARKVINYAVQVASGLAAAHEKSIVHRDLKPENLFVTIDERAKILDFGLAKFGGDGVRGGNGADSTEGTETRLAGTEPGLVLGTFGYMSPEQVRGVAVDHRADIFSFGAVLHELLTGQRAFKGDTAADTMSAILRESPPDLADSGRQVPPALARLVDRCLEKNPARRFQSASDLAFALQTIGTATSTGSGSTIAPTIADIPKERKARAAWAIPLAALIAGAALGALAIWQRQPAPALPRFLEIDIAPPPGHVIELTSALSPDGTRLVYAVTDGARKTQLWLRTLDTGVAAPIPGTDEARNPFWSPDGVSVGFFAGGRLRAVSLETNRVRVICDAVGVRTAGTWNQHGDIVFASENGVPLKRVDVRGGIAPVDLDVGGFRPHFLPDGRHFVFHARRAERSGLHIGSLDSKDITFVVEGRDGTYADGYMIFWRAQQLLAQPFDLNSRSLSGSAVLIADIGPYPASTGPNYTVAGGLIALRRDAQRMRRLVWYTRDGTRQGEIPGDGTWRNPAFSPADDFIAAQRDENQGTGNDIWIVDAAKGTSRVLSADVMLEETPVWSADGRSVTFRSSRGVLPGIDGSLPVSSLQEKPLDGTKPAVKLANVSGTFSGLTPDGRSILSFNIGAGNRDILITPRDGSGGPVPFAQTSFNETQPALSPDGKWLAYVSDERGVSEDRHVFIQAFPDGGRKIHVSIDVGGMQPRWRRDGRELFFLSADRRLMAVPVELAGDTLRIRKPQPLFQTAIMTEGGLGTNADYDVTRDGKRFIVSEVTDAQLRADAAITILVNWPTMVAKGVKPTGTTTSEER